MFGNIQNPYGTAGFNVSALNSSVPGAGLIIFITNFYRLAIVVAGIYSLMNFILAGYGYLSAGGDVKVVQKSTERIWRSLLGLIIIVGSTIIAGIVGYILFGPSQWNILIRPVIYTP